MLRVQSLNIINAINANERTNYKYSCNDVILKKKKQ